MRPQAATATAVAAAARRRHGQAGVPRADAHRVAPAADAGRMLCDVGGGQRRSDRSHGRRCRRRRAVTVAGHEIPCGRRLQGSGEFTLRIGGMDLC